MTNFGSIEGGKQEGIAELSRKFSRILDTERAVLEGEYEILKAEYGADFRSNSIDRLFAADFFEMLSPALPGEPSDLEHEEWKQRQLVELQRLHDDLANAEDESAKKVAARELLDHMVNI